MISVLEIDLATGNRRLLSSDLGSGPGLVRPQHGRFDPAGRRLLVTDRMLNAVLAVDVDTGNRTLISGGGAGTGTAFDSPIAVDINAARTTAYVLDMGLDCIFSVDLSTGNRTVLSGNGQGSGVALDTPRDMVFDETNGRLLVADFETDAIIEISVSTGIRSIAVNDLAIAPIGTHGPFAIEIDRAGNRAFIALDDSVEEDSGFVIYGKIVEMNLANDSVQDLVSLNDAAEENLNFDDLAMSPDGDALYALHSNRMYSIDLDTGEIEVPFNSHAFPYNKISAIETGVLTDTVYMFDELAGAVMLMEIDRIFFFPNIVDFDFTGLVMSR
jgi:DNA-binding beta-propeller fold protein YncE